jgi:hypothetical protein
MGRLAAVWQPTSNLAVTPSILYQRQDKHDESTYWPAYSNPGEGQFNTATPERIGGPDEYYLPALKIVWDLGKSQIISNTSYFHRKQLTAYQGTVYDLSYWQTIPSALGGRTSRRSRRSARRPTTRPAARGFRCSMRTASICPRPCAERRPRIS